MEITSVSISTASVDEVVLGDQFLELFLNVSQFLGWELVFIEDNLSLFQIFEVGHLGWKQE